MNKKGIGLRAVELIITIPVMVICIILLYAWLGHAGVEQQTSVIKGDIARAEIDSILSDWLLEEPSALKNDFGSVQEKLKQLFENKNYRVDKVLCEQKQIMGCNFRISKGEERLFEYNRFIYVPTEGGMKEVKMTGRITT